MECAITKWGVRENLRIFGIYVECAITKCVIREDLRF